MAFHIRPATPQDVKAILELITDLVSSFILQITSPNLPIKKAIYEKEPDAVKATPDLLTKNLFETPYANALLAFSGSADAPGKPIGLALYFFNYSTWTGKPGLYLEDLFVKPEHRANGIGKAFFGHLGRIAQEKASISRPICSFLLTVPRKGCARLDWSVLKWNQPSIDFYEKRLGAKAMSEWMGMRLDEQGIDALKQFLP
ncbi:acyl-CoA N-acyltransferase [Amanita rubescens]|nr:acyl-CoA N-acyltransferase [Amanita rubescens]